MPASAVRISDWSSDVCSSDLLAVARRRRFAACHQVARLQHDVAVGQRPVVGAEFDQQAEAALGARLLAPVDLRQRNRRLLQVGGHPQGGHPFVAADHGDRGLQGPFDDLVDVEAEARPPGIVDPWDRSEEHTSELPSLMRSSYSDFCLKKKTKDIENKSLKIFEKYSNIYVNNHYTRK